MRSGRRMASKSKSHNGTGFHVTTDPKFALNDSIGRRNKTGSTLKNYQVLRHSFVHRARTERLGKTRTMENIHEARNQHRSKDIPESHNNTPKRPPQQTKASTSRVLHTDCYINDGGRLSYHHVWRNVSSQGTSSLHGWARQGGNKTAALAETWARGWTTHLLFSYSS